MQIEEHNQMWQLQPLMCLIFIDGKHRSYVVMFAWLKINSSLPFWKHISGDRLLMTSAARIKHRPVVITCSITSAVHTWVLIVYRVKWARGSVMCWCVLKNQEVRRECDKKDVLQKNTCSYWKMYCADAVSISYQCQHPKHKLTVHCGVTDRVYYLQ